MEERNYVVYMHVAPNGKRYIGITKQSKAENRWRCGESYYYNEYMSHAVAEFGWDNFQHFILFENLTRKEAEEKEIELIAKYDTTNRDKGYNISPGGYLVADETREKLSKAGMGRIPWNKDKKGCFSEETLAKFSAQRKGRVTSEETKEKLRKLFTGRPLTAEQKRKLSEAHKGKEVSAETREKLRKVMIGKNPSGSDNPRSNQVSQYDMSGNRIAVFGSMREAERETGIHFAAIQRCCAGKAYSAGGYIFKKNCDEKIAVKKNPREKQVVVQYDLNGNKLGEYDSILSASKATGINTGAISMNCNGKNKRAGNYIFKKKELR